MDRVRLRDALDDVVVVEAHRASPAERHAALPRLRALFCVRNACARRPDGRTLAELYALACAHRIGASFSGASRDVLLRRIEEAVEQGRLLVSARPRRRMMVPLELDPEPVLGPAEDPTSWIEIELVDSDGVGVPGEAYEIVTAEGKVRSGSLNDRGKAREDAIDPGTCKVTFPRLQTYSPRDDQA